MQLKDMSEDQLARLSERMKSLRGAEDIKLVLMLLVLGLTKDLSPGEALDYLACRFEAERRINPRDES